MVQKQKIIRIMDDMVGDGKKWPVEMFSAPCVWGEQRSRPDRVTTQNTCGQCFREICSVMPADTF